MLKFPWKKPFNIFYKKEIQGMSLSTDFFQ